MTREYRAGICSVLRVCDGDVEINFGDPDEAEKNRHIIDDMIRRGYIVSVESPPGTWTIASGFDPDKLHYRLAGGGSVAASEAHATVVPPVAGG